MNHFKKKISILVSILFITIICPVLGFDDSQFVSRSKVYADEVTSITPNKTTNTMAVGESSNKVITFKDKNLEQVIRQQINKPTGDIYKSDVENITSLYAFNKGIQDISGIENLINLHVLDLNINQIKDISPLSGLTNLQNLHLGWNQVSDISPISQLTNLQILSLLNTSISNINALNGLTNLQQLYLYNNQISDTDIQSLENALPKCKIHF